MRAPTSRLTLRGIAVLSWIVAALWLIFDPGFEPLIAFLTGLAALLTSFATPHTLTDDQILEWLSALNLDRAAQG